MKTQLLFLDEIDNFPGQFDTFSGTSNDIWLPRKLLYWYIVYYTTLSKSNRITIFARIRVAMDTFLYLIIFQ